MKLIRGIHNIRAQHRPTTVTIGNFDGLHLGHQKILQRLLLIASTHNIPATVITTEPLSREFFAPDSAPTRLTRLPEKLRLFEQFGIQQVLCLPFNQKLADMPAVEFVQEILVGQLNTQHIIIGDDARFGKNRTGDLNLLLEMGEQYNFTVEASETTTFKQERVSSTRIRTALGQGNLSMAKQLLGRDYSIYGRVVHGDKRGRELGYPTANVNLHRRTSPVMGIFAVNVVGISAEPLPGVASVGYRPTFGGQSCLLEVHLLDFKKNLYGKKIEVVFLKKFRNEQHFNSAAELIEQMQLDIEKGRKFFAQASGNV